MNNYLYDDVVSWFELDISEFADYIYGDYDA